MWTLKVDINLLKQLKHCKPAYWLADWVTDWLKYLGTQDTWALEHLRQLKGTRALKALRRLEHLGA